MLRFLTVLPLLFISLFACADKITNVQIDVYLRTDRSVQVTETYTFVPRFQIKHGLYRFLPIRYYKNANNAYATPLTIEKVLVNGQKMSYFTKKQIDYEVGSGKKNVSDKKATVFDIIYIGEKDEYLTAGETYTTTLTYTVKNVVLDEEEKSRFSWNIQGFGWEMVRDSVTTRFHLPEGAKLDNFDFFIGSLRESDTLSNEFYAFDEENNLVTLKYASLKEGQDITIDTYFPTGTFESNTASWAVLFANYRMEVIVWGAFIISFLIWFFTWRKVGRDPKGLIRMTYYESPDDMSPAECRYFRMETIDKRTSVATIVQAAIGGYIEIKKKDKEEDLKLLKTEKFNTAPKEVTSVLSPLFGSLDSLTVKKTVSVGKKFDKFKNAQKKRIEKKHPNQFQDNFGHFVMGFFIAIVGMGASLLLNGVDLPRNIFVLALVPLVLSGILWYGLELYLEETVSWSKFPIIAIGVLSLGAFTYFIPQFMYVSTIALLGFVALAFSTAMWRYLMKNRTAFSREMEDKIMGYEHYLRSTEERYLDFLNKPDEAPVLFEKHLPYAIALGCESRWSDAFEKAILELPEMDYHPGWFYSNLGYMWIGHHLYSNVSSNSVAPPSTSGSGSYSGGGFGGGGFSGGGFGGGGGGGW